MKIDNEALKYYYKSFLEEISPPTRVNCPSPELLLKSLRFRISKRKNRKIIKHLFSCVHCSREFEFMIETIKKEKETDQEIGQLFLQSPDEKKPSKRNNSVPVSSIPKKLSYLTTGIVIIVLFSIFMLKTQKVPQFRRTRASPLQIVFPNEIKLQLPQLYFKWDTGQKSDYYIIEIFDETLLPIWRSDKLTISPFYPTEDLLVRLEYEKTYFWMVTSYGKNKKISESRLVDFFLNK